MMKIFAAAAVIATMLAPSASAEEIGTVDTTWNMIGSNDRIVIDAYDDPGVSGVACHVSRAQKGGTWADITGGSNPNEASIACRQIGPIDWDAVLKLPAMEPAVFKEKTAFLFKTLKVARLVDVERKTLVYLVYTTEGWEGSPKNVITSVPVMPWN